VVAAQRHDPGSLGSFGVGNGPSRDESVGQIQRLQGGSVVEPGHGCVAAVDDGGPIIERVAACEDASGCVRIPGDMQNDGGGTSLVKTL
jgi:hypothetical protein